MLHRLITSPPSLSVTPVTVSDFDVVFAPNQVAIIDTSFLASFPDSHGGLQFNWSVPTNTGWTWIRLKPWTWRSVNSADEENVFSDADLITPANQNYEIFPPGPFATDAVFRSRLMIQAPASGGTLQFFIGQQSSSGATPSLVWGSMEVVELLTTAVAQGEAAVTVIGQATTGTIPRSRLANPTISQVSRALGTGFQISTTRPSRVSYGVDVSISSLLTTTAGKVTLQYADNSAFTTNLVSVMSGQSSIGGVLNIANVGTVTLSGYIPAGKWVRILSASTGSPSYTNAIGQEIVE